MTGARAPGDREAGAPAGFVEVWLDVRGLPPPEPMVLTLQRLETLGAGEVLVQVNGREPVYLLPMLTERGYRFVVDQQGPGLFHVRIWRAGA